MNDSMNALSVGLPGREKSTSTLETDDHLRQCAKSDLAIVPQRFQQLALAKNIAQLSRDAHPCMETTTWVYVKVPNLARHDMPMCMHLCRRSMYASG